MEMVDQIGIAIIVPTAILFINIVQLVIAGMWMDYNIKIGQGGSWRGAVVLLGLVLANMVCVSLFMFYTSVVIGVVSFIVGFGVFARLKRFS